MRRNVLNLEMIPSSVWEDLLRTYGTPITSNEDELTPSIDGLTVHTDNDKLTYEEQKALGHMTAFVVGKPLKEVYRVYGCVDGYMKYEFTDCDDAEFECRELNKAEFASDFLDYPDYSFHEFMDSNKVGYKVRKEYR